MGKRIKSRGEIFDASSTAGAPVSPAGTVALRAKPDATQFQYSANGAAWTDFTGGGGGGTVRLDQVLDPDIPPTDPVTPRIKAFAMTDHSLHFNFSGADDEECLVIQSAADALGGGSVLLLRSQGPLTNKAPLRIEGRDEFFMTVAPNGKVAIGAETATERLNVYQTNVGTDNSGLIFGGCTMFVGNTATTVKAVQFQLDDSQDTASLLSMQAMELQLSRTAGVTNTNITSTVLSFDINIGKTTKTVRGLSMSLACVGTITVTDWEGIRIAAPSTIGSPTITNRRAIITESGAGNVGFGTLTPAAQLHVSGDVQIDTALTQFVSVYKYTDTDEHSAQIFYRAKGTTGSPADLTTGHSVGAVSFRGRLGGVFTQLGYVRCFYDSTDIGVTELGSGAADQARVKVTQAASTGTAALIAAPYFLRVGTGGLEFSHGTTGAIYYKDASGFVVSLDSVAADAGKVLTVTDVSGSYLPRWAAAGAGSVRLDQVLDPTLNKAFAMTTTSLSFNYTGSASHNDFVIQSAANATGTGSLLFVGTQGTTNTKSPFRVEANGAFALIVLNNGDTLLGASLVQTLTTTLTSGTLSHIEQNITIAPASSSSAEHRLLDQDVVFSTAQNTSSVRLRYANINHNVAGTLTSFFVDNVTFSQSAGTTSLATGYTVALNFLAGTVSQVQGYGTTIGTSGGTITTGLGFTVSFDNSSGTITTATGFRITTSGTIGTLYAFRSPATSLSGFGTDAPVATLHAVGSVRLDLGSDATGDIYYRSATSGPLARLGASTNGFVLTLAGGIPSWAAAAAGSGAPGGSASELQYRSGASTFGAVSNSAVSGANITLGGTLTLDMASVADQSIVLSAISASDTKITFTEYRTATTPILFQFDRAGGTFSSPANILNNYVLGEFRFRGRLAGAFAQQAYIRALYTTTDGGAVQFGAGATSGSGTRFVATVNSGAGIFDTGGNFFTVSGSGFEFSHGATGAIYYRSAGGLFTALAIGTTSQYLKGGTIPSWGSLDAGHITSGTLALARGGTGSSLTDPNADRIMFWDDSAGVVTWLTAGTGLTITTTTMTASGTTSPAGSGSELQYRNVGAFGAVTSSSVDGSGVVTLGGGSMIWKNDSAVLLSLRLYSSTAASCPQLTIERSRGSEGSKSAVLAGDALFSMPVYGQYDSAGQRQGGVLAFDVQSNFSTSSAPTVFKVKTSHLNSITPIGRLVLGGSKTLLAGGVDNQKIAIFSVTFATADQAFVAGLVHMSVVAKQVSGSAQIQIARKSVAFVAGHNGSANSGNARWGGEFATEGVTSTGGTTFLFECNTTAYPSFASIADVFTFYLTANSDLTTLSELTIHYNIEYNGDKDIVLL